MIFNERGISHVEFIIATVLFLGFVSFALIFLNPLDSNRVLDSSLYYAQNEVAKSLTTTLESYTIVVDEEVSETSLRFPINNPITPEVKVLKSDGVTELAASYDEITKFVHVDRETMTNKVLYVYFSEDFDDLDVVSGPGEIDLTGAFQVSSSDERDVISEKLTFDLKNRYESDYDLLREDFNLPRRVDFAFSLKFDDGSLIEATKNIPEGLQVVVDNDRVEIVDSDSILTFGNLIVKVW